MVLEGDRAERRCTEGSGGLAGAVVGGEYAFVTQNYRRDVCMQATGQFRIDVRAMSFLGNSQGS